jgi:transposase
MLTAEKHRLQQALPALRAKGVGHSRWLAQTVVEGDEELDALLRASLLWRERDELQRHMAGVGPSVSCTVLAHLPELGERSVSQRAALVGLALPGPRQWGVAGKSCHLGWAAAGTHRPLHGRAG